MLVEGKERRDRRTHSGACLAGRRQGSPCCAVIPCQFFLLEKKNLPVTMPEFSPLLNISLFQQIDADI